jgi:hypothetical protein
MTTVTIQVEDELLVRAKALAAAQNTTIEEMIKDLLRVVAEKSVQSSTLPPNTRAALGLLKGLPDRPYKELLSEALIEKYGLAK